MNAPAILRNTGLDHPSIQQARTDLAACFRAAARLGLHEGVCNHLSAMVPGRDDLFLVNPDGWSFAEITASRLLICDFHRRVVATDRNSMDTQYVAGLQTESFLGDTFIKRLFQGRRMFALHYQTVQDDGQITSPKIG